MSWYEVNEKKILKSSKYLAMIEQVFRLKHADKQWKHCALEPHQLEFHSEDIAFQGHNARSNIVEKSRNTSFTTSAVIRLLTGNYTYRDEIVPLVRINEQKVKELLTETKSIIKHMTPIRLANGDLWPFDPKKAVMKNVMEIRFEDRDVIFRGYQGSTTAAENIRGLRITRGLIDESNFMAAYKSLYIAMRDAAAGTDQTGKKYFQLTIGSTLKGLTTPFKLWLDNQKEIKLPTVKIFSWPVFDPRLFDVNKSILEQKALIPIVHWHELQDLENKRLEDINSFLEEYMAVCVPGDSMFYNLGDIMLCVNTKLNNLMVPDSDEVEYYIGIDPSGEGNDYFALSVFAHYYEEGELVKAIQKKLYYIKKCDLNKAQDLVDKIIELWNPVKVRVDGNLLGYQFAQYLKNTHGGIIEVFRGRVNIKHHKMTVSINEYLHTNQKKLFTFKKIELINDDLQLTHYGSWRNNLTCESTKEYGHGDTTISNGLALLPYNWRKGDRAKQTKIGSNIKQEENISDDEIKKRIREYNKSSLLERMKFMKAKNKK